MPIANVTVEVCVGPAMKGLIDMASLLAEAINLIPQSQQAEKARLAAAGLNAFEVAVSRLRSIQRREGRFQESISRVDFRSS